MTGAGFVGLEVDVLVTEAGCSFLSSLQEGLLLVELGDNKALPRPRPVLLSATPVCLRFRRHRRIADIPRIIRKEGACSMEETSENKP